MQTRQLLRLAERVLTLPTAPYHEHAVRGFVVDYCRGLGLRVEMDRAGNVIARHGKGGRPLVFVAHMDHPGFEALGGRRVAFLGGAPQELFPNARIRFGQQTVRVLRVTGRKRMRVSAPVPRGEFGMWELPAFRVRGDRLHAAAIDDVLGVAVVLATLAEVVRRRLRTTVWGVFTRAEEVGFHGAVQLAKSGRIPRGALVVSVEMSRQRPWARIGDGPVVRVGDRMTTFDPHATMFLETAARRCGLKFQRALMDGGACEATAFGAFGYRVGGLCLPLGNYHNIGPGNRPRAEYVSVSDLQVLTDLMIAAAQDVPRFDGVARQMRRRVIGIARNAPHRLR